MHRQDPPGVRFHRFPVLATCLSPIAQTIAETRSPAAKCLVGRVAPRNFIVAFFRIILRFTSRTDGNCDRSCFTFWLILA